MKLLFLCYIFSLCISLTNAYIFGLYDDHVRQSYHGIRSQRGVLKNAFKGAVVGALGNKALGGSVKKGAMLGAATGVGMSFLRKKQ